tara:strand:- start:5230 stop:5793 length:564 start_codon:yes stop_codon:yes gene_type:complete
MRPLTDVGLPAGVCRGSTLDDQRHEASAWAKEWLAWRAPCSSKPAAVFDIDATLLHDSARIEPVVDLYDFAKRSGVTVFIVTARSDEGKEYTHQELDKLGIERPRHLFMHPSSEPCANSQDAARMKLRSRDRITKKGYEIILNIGDAFSDHYVPPQHRALQKSYGALQCGCFVDPNDGVAHVKLGHP